MNNIIIALDFATRASTLCLVDKLDPLQCRLKIGKEMFTRFGPALVKELIAKGFDIFLDLKFHDIPNTVAKACSAAADLGIWMLNVHALGGSAMMEAALKALADYGNDKPLLIAVTILTSLLEHDLHQLGIANTLPEQVLRLARLAQQAHLNGVVCAPQEAALLKQQCGNHFILVTPGIRPANSPSYDQQRIMTPQAAMQAGADYLVIGRPITQAANPMAVIRQIALDMSVKFVQ